VLPPKSLPPYLYGESPERRFPFLAAAESLHAVPNVFPEAAQAKRASSNPCIPVSKALPKTSTERLKRVEKRDLNGTKFDYTPCVAGDTKMAEWGQFLGGDWFIPDDRISISSHT